MLINILWPSLDANKDGRPIWRTGSIFSCSKGLWDCLPTKPITTKHKSVFWFTAYVGYIHWHLLVDIACGGQCWPGEWNQQCITIDFRRSGSNQMWQWYWQTVRLLSVQNVPLFPPTAAHVGFSVLQHKVNSIRFSSVQSSIVSYSIFHTLLSS